jgi:hypothetical protein
VNLNYTNVGAKMIELEGKEVDVCPVPLKRAHVTYTSFYKISPHPQKDNRLSPLKVKKRRCRYVIYK